MSAPQGPLPGRAAPAPAPELKRAQIGVGGLRITERARQLVLEVLDSNRLNAGPMMARFESAIAALHDRRFGLMCNSGTSALHIALAALKEREGWADGDAGRVPALTSAPPANVCPNNRPAPRCLAFAT